MNKTLTRNQSIIRTSLVGVAGNLILAVIKFIIGALANSVSIIADAINNVADTLTSIVTIIGTKLSEKQPNSKHPFGYGRVEYLSSLIIGVVILYVGISELNRSLRHIIHPEESDYSALMLIIIAIAVVVKYAVGFYTKKRGKALDSEPLKASGEETLHDVLMSGATLVAALVYVKTGVSIEAWVAAVISLLIIKTGLETIMVTVGSILGRSADIETARAVKESILSFPEIEDVYDIVIHSYGKERRYGSAHVEVPDVFKVGWIDNLQRAVMRKVREDTGVEMLGLSIYAINTRNQRVIEAREKVQKIVDETEGAIRMHGFYVDYIDKSINCEVVANFKVKDTESLRETLVQKVLELYPDFEVIIKIIHDFTESET